MYTINDKKFETKEAALEDVTSTFKEDLPQEIKDKIIAGAQEFLDAQDK